MWVGRRLSLKEVQMTRVGREGEFEHTTVRAQAVIVKKLSKQVTSLVLRCDRPKAEWDRLVEEFKVKFVQNTMLLRA